ncbi:MAG: Flp pilus assembly protein CpaB [Stellaceae bacterium]
MRGRTLILFAIALMLAGGTAILMRSWLAQRPAVAAAPPPPPPQKSILLARVPIARGHILQASDLAARTWPQTAISPEYVIAGGAQQKSLIGSVAREPFVAGEPIIIGKLVRPGDRGFLAAVLQPGMRAVSVPVDATSGISGFVFPGDRVDILITLPVPQDGISGYQHKAAETVLRDIRVIAIDQQLDSKDGHAVLARTVTFEVTPKQSEIIAVAADIGKLSLSLRSLAETHRNRTALRVAADPPAASRDDRSSDGAADPPLDSHVAPQPPDYTLDSEVSPLLAQPLKTGQNSRDGLVTILRGNGNNGTSVSSQPGSRGS